MFGFLKRMSAPIVLGALILAALSSLVGGRSARDGENLPWIQGLLLDVTVPFQKALAVPGDLIAGAWDSYIDLVDLGSENSRLQAELTDLEQVNLHLREALVSSGHLDRIVEMRDKFEVPMLPAAVAGLDVSPFFRSILIDRGSQHGVRAGHPVINHEGVVGVVSRTSSHAAKVLLIFDRQSAADAVIQRSRTRGTVRGRGTSQPNFEYEARRGDVEVGDVVLTSGLGGVYPKGLKLGEVTEVADLGGSLMQSASVSPAVEFGRLEQVFVILRRGTGMELLYETGEFVDPGPSPRQGAEAGAGQPGEAGS